LAVNLLAPLRLIDLALPDMGRGACIVNVSSMAGRVPIKGCTYQGEAKAGLAMASEIAHVELAARGIRVVTVYPGPVSSGLEAHARGQVAGSLVARIFPRARPTSSPARSSMRMIATCRGWSTRASTGSPTRSTCSPPA